MKKILFALLAGAVLFAGCEKAQDQELPEVSFASASPLISDVGTATFSISSNYAGTEAVTVPVKFSSSNGAVNGTDYSVSAEAFVLGGTAPVTQIVVTPIIYGSKKDVIAEITVPDGFKAGKTVKSSFTISDKLGYVSFAGKKTIMTETAAIEIDVLSANGLEMKVAEDAEFEVAVNTEKSTAVEGTNFKFTDGKTVKVAKGQSSGKLQLEFLGEEADEEHNVLVLDLVDNAKYGRGQNIQMTVTISGSIWKIFNGKWKIEKIVNDVEELTAAWEWCGETAESMTGFPEFNADDSFTIDFSTGTFIPDFKSSFKNYFIGTSNFTTCGQPKWYGDKAYNIKFSRDQMYMAYVIELDNVNRYFSATQTSKSKLAYVGLSIDVEDQNLLHFIVIDHEATTFLIKAAENNKEILYNGFERPTANTGGTGFEVTFTKVE